MFTFMFPISAVDVIVGRDVFIVSGMLLYVKYV